MDRRYSRDEIETIFERASDESRDGPHAAGMTLDELKEIAGEVGIAPERVEAAALELRRERGVGAEAAPSRAAPHPATRDTIGRLERVLHRGPFPLRVAHETPLSRSPDEEEWQRLVADLRGAFHAKGRVREYAGVRQWSNGNLHVLVEPTDGGARLRMRTTRGASQALGTMGALLVGSGIAVIAIGSGPEPLELFAPGFGLLAAAILPLRGWASRRKEQMRALAAHWSSRLS